MTRLWIKEFLHLITIIFSTTYFLNPVNSFPSQQYYHYHQRYLLQTINSTMSTTSSYNETSCSSITCSGHGQCKNENKCICNDGYFGLDCQFDWTSNSRCKNGQLDKNGKCCESGIFDYKDNKCCLNTEKVTLDKNGECCNSGILDKCGTCNGKGYVDKLGKCCQTILDASGLCCHSGLIDACGICNGTGESCKTLLYLELNHEIINQDYSCLNTWIVPLLQEGAKVVISEISDEPTIILVDIIDSNVSEAMIKYKIEKIDNNNSTINSNPCDIKQIISHEKKSVCNNGFCELGENEKCPQDCLYELKTCEMDSNGLQCSGRGICSSSLERGICSCFMGYEGQNCERCSEGFYFYKGLCHKRQYLNISTINQILIIEEKESIQKNSTSLTVNIKDENKEENKDNRLVMAFTLALSIMICLVMVMGIVYYCEINRRIVNDMTSETGTDQSHCNYNDSGESIEQSNLSSTMRESDIRRLRNEILDKDILKSKSLRNLLHNYLQTWIDEQKNPPWMADLYSTSSIS